MTDPGKQVCQARPPRPCGHGSVGHLYSVSPGARSHAGGGEARRL